MFKIFFSIFLKLFLWNFYNILLFLYKKYFYIFLRFHKVVIFCPLENSFLFSENFMFYYQRFFVVQIFYKKNFICEELYSSSSSVFCHFFFILDFHLFPCMDCSCAIYRHDILWHNKKWNKMRKNCNFYMVYVLNLTLRLWEKNQISKGTTSITFTRTFVSFFTISFHVFVFSDSC